MAEVNLTRYKTNRIELSHLMTLGAIIVCLAISACLAMPSEAHAIKTVNQKENAYVNVGGKYTLVNNKSYGEYIIDKAQLDRQYARDMSEPHEHGTLKGYTASLKTFIYLPISYMGSGTMGSPQSVNLTPDGHYAYITYPKGPTSTTGRIIRYDLWKLKQLGADTGDMNALSAAARYYSPTNTRLTDHELELMSCLKIGPWCKIGHGNAFAYNPKDGHLWFIGKCGSTKSNVQRINMETLKPDLKINFNMGSGKYISNNFTFDKKGRCYYFAYSYDAIKIYQGTIKKNKSITFRQVNQGIKNSPTPHKIQSMSYNPKSNRLYMVSNSVVISAPVAKLGKLKPSDVRTTIFNCKREFEDLSFDANGNGLLLVIGWPELMKTTGL